MERSLSDCTAGIEVIEKHGPGNLLLSGLSCDSRAVGPGFLFFALPGLHSDGNSFIGAAVKAGARAVIHSRELPEYLPEVSYFRVIDPRRAMSPVAAAFYGHPSDRLTVIGVTGTEGKSTTVYLIYQLLELSGWRAGFFSTVMSRTGQSETPNPEHQTTPEAPAVHRMLAEMAESGFGYAVVESSSHGLSARTNRLGDVAFDVGIMTNVTHEHLEFHGSWEQYRSDKANLFRSLGSGTGRKTTGAGQRAPAFGVVNADDPSADYFRAATEARVYSFSASGGAADFSTKNLEVDASGESFTIVGPGPVPGEPIRMDARLNLPGAFNVGNALAALITVSTLAARPWMEFLPCLPLLRPVFGRMTAIDRGQPFEVVVDYAHTPTSFEAILPPIRKRIGGRIICVFGSGGERDTAKRPQQGKIASKYCDIVILADEDPRNEDPRALLEEIAAGCEGKKEGADLLIIPDRPTAIRAAFSLARKGDLVLLLGKGHENSIIYSDGPHPYDEVGEAVAALAEAGYTA